MKWYFQTVVLEKTLESSLDNKEIKPVNPKGNQPWLFVGMTDAEAEAPILGPPDTKSQLTEKDADGGKDWGQEEKWVTEDEMVDSITDSMDMNLSKLQGDTEGEGSLGCCSPWGHRVGHKLATEQQQYSRLCFRCWGYCRKDNKRSRWAWTLNMNVIQNMSVTKHNVTWYSLFSPLRPHGL